MSHTTVSFAIDGSDTMAEIVIEVHPDSPMDAAYFLKLICGETINATTEGIIDRVGFEGPSNEVKTDLHLHAVCWIRSAQ